MEKRWTAVLLALILTVSLLAVPAQAAESEGAAGSGLTGLERTVYDYLKKEAAKIADGTRTSTEIKIPDQSQLSWPLSELGSTGTAVSAGVEKKIEEVLDIKKVFNCLTLDCPYELFWRSDRFYWGYTMSQSGGRVSVQDLTLRIEASPGYQGNSASFTNPSKIAAANRVVENARAIVEKYRDASDYDKLTAYREEICRLASYNNAAAGGRLPYGDAWQMIYVFDGDPDTSVVCEGYAKAFQYLCDQTEFDGDVTCRTVSGTMDSGDHMWNVVRMEDGRNYLVDVTNCDSGSVGADDKLFLTGASASADGRTYTVSKDRLKAVYTYGEDQEGLYTDGYLAVSGTDYVPAGDAPADDTPEPGASTEQPEPPAMAELFTDVLPEAYYARPVAWAVEQGVTNGTTQTTFSPGQPCTHGQILTFLWRAAGEPMSSAQAPLALSGAEYYAGAVRWAAEKGMLGDEFDPEEGCARADAVWYIWCAFDGPDTQVGAFEDVPPDVSYAHAVGWAVLAGVTTGTSDTTFDPHAVCDRGQIVTFLYRAYSQTS